MRTIARHCLTWALRLLASVAILCLLTSCGTGEKPKTIVRFWNNFTGPDGRTMLRLVKRFNQENPDVQVVMQRMAEGTYYNKLFVARLGGRGPDVFIVHVSRMERFLQAKFVREVDDLIAGEGGIPQEDFAPNVWSALDRGGKHYGVPLDVHLLGVYYNKKLLREAGIVNEQGEAAVPQDGPAFLDALQKLTKKNAAGQQQWGFVFTWWRTNVYTVMSQFGGEFFTPDSSKCVLDNPQNVAALQWCVDLIRKYKVAPPPENFDSWIGFRQGKVALCWEGVYMLADVQKQKDLEYAGATVPTIGTQPAVWADSHVLCLRRDIEGEQSDATMRFVKFLSDNSLDWAEGGQVPVRQSLLASDRFKKMPVPYEFSKQLPNIRYVPKVPFIFEFFTEFDWAIEMALRGKLTPQEALSTASGRINKVIARRNADLARIEKK